MVSAEKTALTSLIVYKEVLWLPIESAGEALDKLARADSERFFTR